MIIGITGGIGSGKSTVIKIFSKFKNIAIYLADNEAKALMNSSKEIKEKLSNEFSVAVYKNNQLDRNFLANIVFNNKEKLAILNSIVHPIVLKHFQKFVQKNKDKAYILYENAILFENENDKMCDKIITVTAPENLRIERVILRDKVKREAVINRINNQWADTKKVIQSHYIINNITLIETEKQVASIHRKLNMIENHKKNT